MHLIDPKGLVAQNCSAIRQKLSLDPHPRALLCVSKATLCTPRLLFANVFQWKHSQPIVSRGNFLDELQSSQVDRRKLSVWPTDELTHTQTVYSMCAELATPPHHDVYGVEENKMSNETNKHFALLIVSCSRDMLTYLCRSAIHCLRFTFASSAPEKV